MAKQIVARQQGDDYQARWFWLQACALLDDFSKVERVVYEDDKLRSFDDVAVYYCSDYTDEKGMSVDADFYQVKFHVTSAGALTAESLCDPAFIGAKRVSLLHRIKDAQEYGTTNNVNHRLLFMTPWSVHPDDPLAEIHSQNDGGIRWETLAQGGERSRMGKTRRLWKAHLGLQLDDELRQALANVRFSQGPTLIELARNLNYRLEANGLKAVPGNALIHPYDELTRKMLAADLNQLTAESMREICDREGLLVGTPTKPVNVTILGIRSFLRWAEDLQHQTQSIICLSHRFSDRQINNHDHWNVEIPNSLETFVREHFVRGGSYRLHLDTHWSIAFLVGNLLPEKMGVNVEVVQHSSRGTSLWSFSSEREVSSGFWEFTEENLRQGSSECALAIGLTHNIRHDVTQYLQASQPSVGRLILAQPVGGPSPSAVRDGRHAVELANRLTQYLRSRGTGEGTENRVHIFSAAPNGFVFCLGRKMQSFPHWTLYEHDFDSGRTGAYSQSITNHHWR